MEANVYRYFTECHPYLKLCEYEPHLFTFQDGLPPHFSYLPDFRITDYEGNVAYVEVKGVWDKRSINAINVMRRFRPDIELHIIDSKLYKEIEKKFSKKIKGWEY